MLASLRREVLLWKAGAEVVELPWPSRGGERAVKGETSEQLCVWETGKMALGCSGLQCGLGPSVYCGFHP